MRSESSKVSSFCSLELNDSSTRNLKAHSAEIKRAARKDIVRIPERDPAFGRTDLETLPTESEDRGEKKENYEAASHFTSDTAPKTPSEAMSMMAPASSTPSIT